MAEATNRSRHPDIHAGPRAAHHLEGEEKDNTTTPTNKTYPTWVVKRLLNDASNKGNDDREHRHH
jgi:hypothetical protein